MNRLKIALAMAAFAWSAPALAQTRTSPIVAPDRPDQRPTLPRSHREAIRKARRTPKTKAAALEPFRLASIQVLGSSLPPERLQAVAASFVGQVVGSKELKEISQRLAAVYAQHSGLALYAISIPEQSPTNGVLRVEATEGFIQGVKVQGPASKRDHHLLLHYANQLTTERPLRKATLERYASLIRDIPGLNPVLEFAQGATPGAMTMVITIQPKTLEFGASINNRGTAYLGRTQVELDASLHGLFREGDDTHVTFAFPTDLRRFRYYGVSHTQPIGGEGLTAQLSFGYLTTRPSFYDLHGHATSLGLQFNAPVIRRYDRSLFVTLGVDGLNSDNALLGQVISDDRTRSVRTAVTYSQQTDRYYFLANGAASFGFDGFGARVFNPAYSNLEFHKINLKLTGNIALPHDTILRLNSAVQYTGDTLPGAEQFALGGEEFGRGYEAAVVSGDRGAAGSAEFAWKLRKVVPAQFAGSEVYGFVDGGRTQSLGRGGGPTTDQTLASMGGGGRVALASKAVLQLEFARGLTNPLATEDHEDWRGVFSLKTVF